jgi:hypothetical protein
MPAAAPSVPVATGIPTLLSPPDAPLCSALLPRLFAACESASLDADGLDDEAARPRVCGVPLLPLRAERLLALDFDARLDDPEALDGLPERLPLAFFVAASRADAAEADPRPLPCFCFACDAVLALGDVVAI